MREILFRGKRLDNGEWVEGCLVTGYWYWDDKAMVTIMPVDNIFYYMGEVSGWNVVDPSTIGQFTGLCDKNGKKIFEGDIIKRVASPMVVVWNKDDASFFAQYSNEELKLTNTLFGSSRLEVIGNIYDNPELLEGEG